MNARELFAALAGITGARRLSVGADGIAESTLVSGVEVARASSADDRALRRAWRARSGGGADPLLVVADDPDAEGAVRSLGPLRADGPLRIVGADQLLDVLRRLPSLSRLEAVRTLAEELDRLDRASVAGLVVRGLGTDHLYRERLRTSPRWAELGALAEVAKGRWALREGRDLGDEERRQELEAACLTFVFRVFFLLYAESSGYLPVGQEMYRRGSRSQIVRDAHEQGDRLDPRSTALWDRLLVLVRAMRTGNDALAVPAYDGDLFAADGFEGAEVLEQATLSDAVAAPALVALGIDPETGSGIDYSGRLEIGHLGNIYEGLLSLRLAVADRDLRYDPRADRYVTADPASADVRAGELL